MPRLSLKAGMLLMLCCAFIGPVFADDDIDQLELPIIESRDGYTLSITEYEASSQHNLLEDDPPEHNASLTGWLRAPEGKDVMCFGTALRAVSAENDDGDDLIVPKRSRKENEYAAVLPSTKVNDRKGKPIPLAQAELESIDLRRPGYEIKELVIEAKAVVIEEKESAEMNAVVADRFVDVGHGHEIQVTSMEVDKRGMMTVKLDARRAGGETGPVIESLYALNAKGEVIGGGRWTNELDVFANAYDVEMAFPLNAETTTAKLRLVFATEYEIQTIKFAVKNLYQR